MRKNKTGLLTSHILMVLIISAAVYSFSGCSDSITNSTVTTPSKYKARTEAEFNSDASLKTIPGAVVYVDLEHLNSPASGVNGDTGPIGEDVIAYSYTETATHRLKLGAEAKFKARLVNESGAVIYQLNNPGDTARVSIPAGNYKLYLTSLVNYGSDSMGTQPVFIQPDLDAIASGGVLPQGGYNRVDLNTLLTTNKCIDCNLSEVQLYDKNLAGVNLTYSYLGNSFMKNVNLSGGIFYETGWSNAGANDCIFAGADFTSAELYYTTFRGGDFRHAVFKIKSFKPTTFIGSDMRYVTFENGSCLGKMDGCDLSYSTFTDFVLKDLTGEHVNLIGATFSNVRTFNVSFVNSNWDSTIINDSYFKGIDLRSSTFRYAAFTNFRGDGSRFENCIMTGSRITNSGFNGGTLRSAILKNTIWNKVDILAVNMCLQDRAGASITNMRFNIDTKCWP